jgi:hypothetical protein
MQLDLGLDKVAVEYLVCEVTEALALVYKQITAHYGWPFRLPDSTNWQRRRKLAASSTDAPGQSAGDDGRLARNEPLVAGSKSQNGSN